MKLVYYFVFILLFYIPSSSSSEEDSDYHYCNIYAQSICFGISQNDSVTIHRVADYFLYEIDLAFDVNIQLYYGHNPEVLEKLAIKIAWLCKEEVEQCDLYFLNKKTYRIIYQLKKNAPILDIHIGNVGESNIHKLNDFLNNFRKCRQGDFSFSCDQITLFKKDLLSSVLLE